MLQVDPEGKTVTYEIAVTSSTLAQAQATIEQLEIIEGALSSSTSMNYVAVGIAVVAVVRYWLT